MIKNDLVSGIRIFREKYNDKNFHFFRNISLKDHRWLMDRNLCLVRNSCSGIREEEFIGTLAVNICTRQKDGARCENVIDVDYDHKSIKAIEEQINHGKYNILFRMSEFSNPLTNVIRRFLLQIMRIARKSY